MLARGVVGLLCWGGGRAGRWDDEVAVAFDDSLCSLRKGTKSLMCCCFC
jgi:hypothetical protein